MASARKAQTQRETEYAIRIDDLTAQIKDQKALQLKQEELERENTIAQQQLTVLKS